MVTSNRQYLNRYVADYPGEMGAKFVLFFLWPFGGWLYALKSANTRSSMVIFFLFSLLVCWHFSPTGYNNHYDDFLGILDRFESNSYSTSQLMKDITAYFTFSENAPKEIYEEILNWFVKLFTSNYHLFFLLAAIPVAYCLCKYVKLFVTDYRFVPNFVGILLLLMAVLPRDIVTVQNPRFVTGFWICALCSILYYCRGRNWLYVLPIIFSPLMHSGMWPYVGFFLGALFVPKKMRLLHTVAICTIPFMFFDPGILKDFNFSILPPGIQIWAERYMSDDAYATFVVHEGRSGFWWVAASFKLMMRFAYIYMTVMMMRNPKIISKDPMARNFYPFYIIIFSLVNLIQFVPVLGERYYMFTRVFCILIWFKAFIGTALYKRGLYFLVIACSFSIIQRYGYFLGGALSVNTPVDLFFTPLPYLMGKGLIW